MNSNNSTHMIVRVTCDEKVIKNRSFAQSVIITTEEFSNYMLENSNGIDMYEKNMDWIYDKIPENLEGKLCYKDLTWDFMGGPLGSISLVAAVSEKVKIIFEELGVSKDEYVFKPVKIKGYDITYYLLFVKYIPMFSPH